MIDNPENYATRVRMHPEEDAFYIDAEAHTDGYSFYQSSKLNIITTSSSYTVIGSTGAGDYSVNINGALATRVERSRNMHLMTCLAML
jgi:hypothetical protein